MTQTTTLARANGQLATRDKPLSETVRALVSRTLTGRRADEFVTAVVNLVSQDPKLAECDRLSLVGSALQAQSLNLSLNKSLGQAFVVPFRDKKAQTTKATFQIGYKGYIQLAIRSGQYRKLNVLSIKEGELRFFDPLNEELEVDLIQDEEQRANAPTIGYYAMFEYLNGFRKAMYWSKARMEAHARKYSQSYGNDIKYGSASSFWSKDFDAMAQKTMLRQIIGKWGIMSTDLIQAMETDMKIAHGINDFSEIVDAEATVAETDAEPGEPEADPVQEKQSADRKRAAKAISKSKAKDAAPPAATEPEPETTEEGEISCPLGQEQGIQKMVSTSDCMKCEKRPGCPEWP